MLYGKTIRNIVIALHTYLGRFHTHTHTDIHNTCVQPPTRHILLRVLLLYYIMFTRDRFRL